MKDVLARALAALQMLGAACSAQGRHDAARAARGARLFHDLDGVLAPIAACDVVVTASNVTAHLAGASGKRTLPVYLVACPPFHWATDASGRSLWYPSMRIVTGARINSWEGALQSAGDILGE